MRYLSSKMSVRTAIAALLIGGAALSGCGAGDADVATTSAASVTTLAGSPSVDDIAQAFRQAVDARDADLVVALSPTTSDGTREFLIGGGPYGTVDCYQFDGRDECRVINGIADFTFVVDVTSGRVSDVTYVGGE